MHEKSCNRLLSEFEFTFLCSVGKLLFAFISTLAYNALCRMSPELLKLPLRGNAKRPVLPRSVLPRSVPLKLALQKPVLSRLVPLRLALPKQQSRKKMQRRKSLAAGFRTC